MSRHIDLALIGGTGLYRFPGLEAAERHAVDTPYGIHPTASSSAGSVASASRSSRATANRTRSRRIA